MKLSWQLKHGAAASASATITKPVSNPYTDEIIPFVDVLLSMLGICPQNIANFP